MRTRALKKTAILTCVVFAWPLGCVSQEAQPSLDVRSILREASEMIPEIEKTQQASVAYNISGQQMRADDLAGALRTLHEVGDNEGRVFAASNLASMLAWRGQLPLALDLIQSSTGASDPSRAQAYHSIAQSLAGKHAFGDALRVVQLIQSIPRFFGQSNLLVQSFMDIQAKQLEAGDRKAAESTTNLALEIAQREVESPSDPEFAESWPAGLYGTIATELAREGNRESALAVLERIYGLAATARTSTQKQDTLFGLAYSQANIGELESALSTAEQLEPGQRREGVMMVIAAQRTKNDPSAAVDEAMALSYQPWRNASLRGIADSFAAAGNYFMALATVDMIDGAGERAYGYAELALEQAEHGDLAASQTVEMASQSARAAGSETKPYVFEFIAVTHAILGDFSKAEDIIGRMAGASRVWPLWNVTEMLVENGRDTEALALAESQTEPHPRAYALLGTATALIDKQREASRKGDQTSE